MSLAGVINSHLILATVLERRFDALGWDWQLIAYAPAPEHLARMRLHAMLINPALTGLDYVERVATALRTLCDAPAALPPLGAATTT